MNKRAGDIVFIINPSLWYADMYPSGVLCLSGYLEYMGFKNTILDSKLSNKRLSLSQRENIIIDTIAKLEPRVVCFSSTHLEFNEVVRINEMIKRINEKIITIVGGAQPSYRATDFLDNGFTFVCIGAGESTLYEFVQEIFNETYRWNMIQGLAWKNSGSLVCNEMRDLNSDAETIDRAMPAYNKIDTRYFDMKIDIIRGLPIKGATLLTSRGCPFSCSYCGCNLIFGKRLRFKPRALIEAEIKYLRDTYDIEGIWIIDDTFTIHTPHAIETCDILKRYNMLWACQSRVDTINEPLIKIMKDAGCIQIDFGVESGSQRILDEIIGKGTTVEQAIRAFDMAKRHGIRTFANFMIGLPTETYDDLQSTIKLADRLNADMHIFSIATPLPGTKLYDMIGEEISPHEYSLLNWNGSALTEKLNKSKIKNLAMERNKLVKRYIGRSRLKSFLWICKNSFLMKRKHGLQRLKFMVDWFIHYMLRPNFSRPG